MKEKEELTKGGWRLKKEEQSGLCESGQSSDTPKQGGAGSL